MNTLHETPAVCAHDLTVTIDGRTVLDRVTFNVLPGQVVLVVGTNGAGKSTLLRTVSRLLPHAGGKLQIFGRSVNTLAPAELIATGVRFLAQGTRCFDPLRPEEHRRVLQRLYGFAESPPLFDETNSTPPCRTMAALSIGERKLECLKMLTAGNPRLFLLDEPHAGLDATWREKFATWIFKMRQTTSATFIIAEHEFSELLPAVDMIIVLRAGSVSHVAPCSVFGSLDEIRKHY